MMMKTYTPKAGEVPHHWYVLDADGKALGRLATQVATVLKGKLKPAFTPHLDLGDHVVIVDAERVRISGRKIEQESYFRHSGYPGGARFTPLAEVFDKRPEEVVRLAVRGMLPRNRLGRAIMRKLKIYRGPEHPHVSQMPEPFPWRSR
jgi:large subunit ribosomal protein L13